VIPVRRHSLAIAALAAVTGGGMGLQAGESGVGPGLGMWVALLGFGGLIAIFLSAPIRASDSGAAVDDAGWTEFRRELRRARRNARSLTLLRIAGNELPTDGPDGPSDLATRSRRLGLHLRLVDRTWVDDGSIYVLLPESPRAAADVLLTRIRAESPAQLPEHVRIATFPEDGLTSGAIIAAVNGGAVDAVPIPIRPTTSIEPGEAAAFALEDDRSVGEAVRS
jgi:hypothetical protein